MVLYKWNIAKEETDDCEQSCPKQATQDVVGDKFTIMHLTAAGNEWTKVRINGINLPITIVIGPWRSKNFSAANRLF